MRSTSCSFLYFSQHLICWNCKMKFSTQSHPTTKHGLNIIQRLRSWEILFYTILVPSCLRSAWLTWISRSEDWVLQISERFTPCSSCSYIGSGKDSDFVVLAEKTLKLVFAGAFSVFRHLSMTGTTLIESWRPKATYQLNDSISSIDTLMNGKPFMDTTLTQSCLFSRLVLWRCETPARTRC